MTAAIAHPPGLFARLAIYQAERFPLARTSLLVAIFSAASVSVSAHLAGRAPPSVATYAAAALVTLLFFFQLRVLDEIKDYGDAEDPLTRWALDDVPPTAFPSTSTEAVVEVYSNLLVWVQNQPRFGTAALNKFARGADGWVIAHAAVHGLTVVSMEVTAPQSKNDARIPDVCAAHGVPHVNTYAMLRSSGVRFE